MSDYEGDYTPISALIERLLPAATWDPEDFLYDRIIGLIFFLSRELPDDELEEYENVTVADRLFSRNFTTPHGYF